MSVLKHLKTLQHVSIIIQIIFRELVGSLLKSLNLKVFKIVTFPKFIYNHAAASPQLTFTILKTFKFSDFNKEPTSSLKMIWITIETCWSVFKRFNTDILD